MTVANFSTLQNFWETKIIKRGNKPTIFKWTTKVLFWSYRASKKYTFLSNYVKERLVGYCLNCLSIPLSTTSCWKQFLQLDLMIFWCSQHCFVSEPGSQQKTSPCFYLLMKLLCTMCPSPSLWQSILSHPPQIHYFTPLTIRAESSASFMRQNHKMSG